MNIMPGSANLIFCSSICRGGCRVLLCFHDRTMDSDLSRLEANKWIFARSAFKMNLLSVEDCLH